MNTSDPSAVPESALSTSIALGAKEFQLKIAHGAPAAAARRAVARVLATWELSVYAQDALLVMTELVYNVTRHTVSACELNLALHRAVILIEVTDSSPQPPVQRAQDPRRAGGRGLLIVAAVAHRWGYRPLLHTDPPGKVVWAELALHPAD